MKVTRREFLALSCQIGAGIALSGCLGIDMKPTRDYVEEVRKMDRIKTASARIRHTASQTATRSARP